MKNLISFLLLLSAGPLVLGAQASQPQTKDQAPRVFKMDLGARFPKLNPLKADGALEAQVFTGLYEGLTVLEPATLKPQPGCAETWTVSPDLKTYTFKIRKGLKFSDGNPLTARTFVETWKTALGPEGTPFGFLLDDIQGVADYRQGRTRDFSAVGITAPDEETLVLKLNESVPHILSILAHYSFAPVSPAQVGVPDWNQLKSLVVNGPYQISLREKDRLVLVKNPLYWDAKAVAIESLELTFGRPGLELTKAFQMGAYDWLSGDMDFSVSLDRNSVLLHPMFASHYFYFLSDVKPWTDHRVRKALLQMLPLEEIRKKQDYPGTTLVPPFQGYPNRQGLNSVKIEDSKKLLAEAGFPEGEGLGTLKIRIPDSPGLVKIVQSMKEVWEKNLKITVEITPEGWETYEASAKRGGFQLGYQGWIADFPDPMAFLLLWKTGGSLNYYQFSDPVYDDMLKKAAGLPWEKRLEALAKAEDYLLDRGALLPLGFSTALNLIDLQSIGGWFPNPLDLHPFKNLYFKPGKAPPYVTLRFDQRRFF